MEARLFFISLWCGVYGQLLRLVFRVDRLSEKTWVAIVMNSLFWATGAALFGMLLASMKERLDDVVLYSIQFAAAGLVLGAAAGYWKGRDTEKREHLLKDNLEWADTGFSAILLASIVMFFVIQAFKIPSGSMRMTFIEGDHLFVNKFIYGIPVPFTRKKVVHFKDIEDRDIVIFRFPSDDKSHPHYGKDFIKRVVAKEGQTVLMNNKSLIIDGQVQTEPYAQYLDDDVMPGQALPEMPGDDLIVQQGRDNFGPVVVPKDHIFVMGDNRDRSYDSRFWGPLPLDHVKGKAWLLYWPPSRIKIVR